MHRVVIIGWRVIAVGLLLPIVWFNVQLWRDPIPAPELLETLEQDLEDGAGDDMQRMFPEGYVITHALVGFSWINIALQTTNTDDLEHAINRARWAEQRIDTEKARAIFPATLPLKHGAFYRGYLAWLRGGIVKASGENRRATDVDAFKWDCEAIATALRGSDSPYLESYKNAVWPADTVFAVAALSLHDSMFEPSYQSDITTWLARVEERFDPKSGMVPHSAHTNAKESDIARGVSSVVMNRMLFEISPAVSSEHYQKTRARFATTRAGFFHGILEYPPGSPGRGDVDSGPLIFGLSLSATVVGIGGALLHDDPGFFEPVSSLFHAMGFPIFGRYGLGLLPVGEAFFVNALTTVSWVDPKAPDPVKYEPLVPVGWRWRWHLFSAFVVAMLLLPELLFRRLRKRDQALVDSL